MTTTKGTRMATKIERPAGLSTTPTYRFWGSQEPPRDAKLLQVATGTGSGATAEQGVTDATIRLYGPIDSWGGFWGVSAEEVAAVLDALGPNVENIQLRINSPGGEVWEGLAILNMLRAHPARVTAVVDGVAASAASFVAVGCDETVMSPGTQMMIHDARTFAWGPPKDLRKTAEILDTLSDSSADLYAEKAGGDADAWRALMVEETWYTAKEAVAAGLAARVDVVPDLATSATAGAEPDAPAPDAPPAGDPEQTFDLSLYKHAGRSHAPAPAAIAAGNHPTASADGNNPTQEGSTAVAFSDEQLTTMRHELGLPGDADEATIVAALSEALAERAEPAASTTTPAAPVVPTGQRLIPEAAYEELQQNARLGAQAAEQLRIQQRDQFLDAHRDRFAPSNRAAWEAQYDANPQGTREYLETAPVIVPIGEIGHDVAPQATAEDDSWFPGYTTPTTASEKG